MSLYNDKKMINVYENKNKKETNFNLIKNANNNSDTINTTKMNSSSTIYNNYQESQNTIPNFSNFNNIDKEYLYDINQININNEINERNSNPTNIDEIIKNQMSSALIDSFLNENQIKSIPMFILYLSEIWKELSKETNIIVNINLGINNYAFNKYYNLPGLIGQRLFDCLNKRKNGYLSADEFISGMCTIFCEEINSLINFIFNFYDFDEDGFITFDDIHAVLFYIPLINGFDDMIDIEQEIHSTIDDIFINQKEKIDFNTFYDLIIRKERYELFIPLISFFYDNKPFNNEEINLFYSEYYNEGKLNINEGFYKIKNVISLKEFETKEKMSQNKIYENFRYKSPKNKNFLNSNTVANFKVNYSSKRNKIIKDRYLQTDNDNKESDVEKDYKEKKKL